MNKKILFLIIVLVGIILLIPMIPIGETYNTTETYDRRLRYKVISEDVDRRCFGHRCDHWWKIELKNVDVVGGNFAVTYKWKETWPPYTCKNPGDCIWARKTDSQYLASGETRTFQFEFNSTWLEPVITAHGYTVLVPIVADTRVVMKHRTHYKSIIQILLELM